MSEALIVTRNCFQANLELLCKKYNLNYELIYAACWSFKYNNGNTIYEKIKVCDNLNKVIKEFIGLNVEYIYDVKKDEIIAFIENCLTKDANVLAEIDGYICNWNPAYQKVHINHMCNIIHLDFVNNRVLCLDPFFSDQIYFITFNDLINGYTGIRLVKKMIDKPNTNYINLYSLMVENFEGGSDCIINEYRKFANDILNIKHFNELFDCDDAALSLFIQSIKNISLNRSGLANLLNKLHDNGIYKSEAKDLHLLYSEISKNWEYILMSFLKMNITKIINPNMLWKISNKIIEVSYKEAKVFDKICQVYRGDF